MNRCSVLTSFFSASAPKVFDCLHDTCPSQQCPGRAQSSSNGNTLSAPHLPTERTFYRLTEPVPCLVVSRHCQGEQSISPHVPVAQSGLVLNSWIVVDIPPNVQDSPKWRPSLLPYISWIQDRVCGGRFITDFMWWSCKDVWLYANLIMVRYFLSHSIHFSITYIEITDISLFRTALQALADVYDVSFLHLGPYRFARSGVDPFQQFRTARKFTKLDGSSICNAFLLHHLLLHYQWSNLLLILSDCSPSVVSRGADFWECLLRGAEEWNKLFQLQGLPHSWYICLKCIHKWVVDDEESAFCFVLHQLRKRERHWPISVLLVYLAVWGSDSITLGHSRCAEYRWVWFGLPLNVLPATELMGFLIQLSTTAQESCLRHLVIWCVVHQAKKFEWHVPSCSTPTFGSGQRMEDMQASQGTRNYLSWGVLKAHLAWKTGTSEHRSSYKNGWCPLIRAVCQLNRSWSTWWWWRNKIVDKLNAVGLDLFLHTPKTNIDFPPFGYYIGVWSTPTQGKSGTFRWWWYTWGNYQAESCCESSTLQSSNPQQTNHFQQLWYYCQLTHVLWGCGNLQSPGEIQLLFVWFHFCSLTEGLINPDF